MTYIRVLMAEVRKIKIMKESNTGTDRGTFDLDTWINGSLAVRNLVIGLFNFWWMEMVKLLT